MDKLFETADGTINKAICGLNQYLLTKKSGGLSYITKSLMSMKVDGHPSTGRLRKRWMDCVKDEIKIKGVSMEMTSDRREWQKKTCCADPT
jgi:hypothetical protein